MISIVIPAYNEADSVGETVLSVVGTLRSADVGESEVIVVDDGSSDGTAQEAARAGARVLRHPQKAGYGHSLKDGITAARFDTIVIMDADGTYPPEAIPQLVKRYRDGFDMVIGARQGKHYHQSFMKKVSRIILKAMVKYASGTDVPDVNSGLRVFSKAVIMRYFPRLCNTFSFTTSLTLAYIMMGKFVAYMPISYDKRTGASKVRIVRDALRTMQFIVEAIVYYNPLKIFMLASAVLIAMACAGFVFTFLSQYKIGYVMGVGSLLLSILVFALGLLAVLLKSIMHQADR